MHYVRRASRNLIVLLLAAGLAGGCGREPDAPERERAAPAEVAPEATVSALPVADGREPAHVENTRYTGATLARIQRGMTPQEVAQIAGNDGYSVGGDGGAIVVLRYEDAAGNYFTVRYDEGVLRTRTSLHRPQAAPSTVPQSREASTPPAAAGDRPVAEIAPGVFVPLERAVASSAGQPRGVANAPLPQPDEEEALGNEIHWTPPAGKGSGETAPAVVVAGGSDGEDRSYQPRARLPEFTRSLRDGVFELRFVNPGDSTIRVGIRQENLGLDATVPPGDSASLKVDKGIYELFFIRESEPYTRYEAEPVTIDGFTATDLEIRLDPADVGVSLIDYGKPAGSR